MFPDGLSAPGWPGVWFLWKQWCCCAQTQSQWPTHPLQLRHTGTTRKKRLMWVYPLLSECLRHVHLTFLKNGVTVLRAEQMICKWHAWICMTLTRKTAQSLLHAQAITGKSPHPIKTQTGELDLFIRQRRLVILLLPHTGRRWELNFCFCDLIGWK